MAIRPCSPMNLVALMELANRGLLLALSGEAPELLADLKAHYSEDQLMQTSKVLTYFASLAEVGSVAVVLSDGETFGNLSGAVLAELPNEDAADLDEDDPDYFDDENPDFENYELIYGS